MKNILYLFAFLGCTFLSSCGEEDYIPLPGNTNTVKVTVSGLVLDENNLPLGQVNVTAQGHTATTDEAGIFLMENITVPGNRGILQFSKPGFSARTHAFLPATSVIQYVRVVLLSDAPTHTMTASGGTVSLSDGSSIQFQPSSFVTTGNAAYNGTVSLSVKHLSPDETNFSLKIPGSDLAAKDAANRDVTLQTFGMIGVELKGSSGESIQLASGKTAEITFPIAPSQLASAPQSMPLWYFDESTSLWKQEGTAIRNGGFYVGTVEHFSWWNIDVPYNIAQVSGKVVDCNGNPMPNITVTFNNMYTLITNQNGIYQSWVPAGIPLTVQVLSSYNGGIFSNSQLESVPSLTVGQAYVVPDLVVPCPATLQGILKTCYGNNTPGTVYISNQGGFVNFQYTSTGSFTIPVQANTQLTLHAYNSTGYTNWEFTSPAAAASYNTGNLFLCQAPGNPPNSIVVNGPSFANELILVNPTGTTAGVWNDSLGNDQIFINLNGGVNSGSQYQVVTLEVSASGNSTGTYPWNVPAEQFAGMPIFGNGVRVSINDNFLTSYYDVYSLQDSGSVTITQLDGVGGRIKGYFSGSVSIYALLPLAGPNTLTGNFDVYRSY